MSIDMGSVTGPKINYELRTQSLLQLDDRHNGFVAATVAETTAATIY